MYFLANLDQIWESPNSHPTRIQLTSHADPTHIQRGSNSHPIATKQAETNGDHFSKNAHQTHIQLASNAHLPVGKTMCV